MEFLKVSDNGRFLVTESGAPFFWLGDTAWELFHRLSREEAEVYLDNRASRGFNVIQSVVLAERDGLHTPNVYGDTPLLDDDPTRFNEAYFAYVDDLIRLAESKGLYIGLLPTWGDKVDLVGGAGPVIFNPDNAYAFGELVGRRWRDQPNIIWILGGDRYPDGFEDVWRAMARGIKAGTQGRALITYHPRGAGQSSTRLHHESWLDFNLIQSGHGKFDVPNWEMIAADYRLSPTKPTLDAEPPYETHPVAFDKELRQGRFTDYDVRKGAYRAVLAGACGHTYGHHSVWQMHKADYPGVTNPANTWDEAILAPGAAQLIHLRHLIESRPFLTRIPDDRLLLDTESEPSRHVSASRDVDGSYALIYLPTANQTVTIRLESLSGSRFNASWYDPRSGVADAIDTFDRVDYRAFVSPSSGPDWVLVIAAADQGFTPPGTP